MIFLDNASTLLSEHMNPNANYAHNERKILLECEDTIKQCIGVNSGHVLYFRTATDCIEWLASKFCTDETWCSPYEHDSVYKLCGGNVFNALENDRPKYYNLQDYTLYIHQLVNHLDGRAFNTKLIAKNVYHENDGHFFAIDATQAIGKIELPKNMDEYADAIFMSGHKIGHPYLSFMWVSDKLCDYLGATNDIRNQWGMKHGTLVVQSVYDLTQCVKSASAVEDTYWFYLVNKLDEKGIKWHCQPTESNAFAINLITLDGINADALQTYLASKDCYVGIAASACSDSHDYRVANALGLTNEEAEQSIRVSFSAQTSLDDIDGLVNLIVEYKEKFII